MDAVQRRLHTAGRNPERLEKQPPDAERHRPDHQQQIQKRPDLEVAVQRGDPVVFRHRRLQKRRRVRRPDLRRFGDQCVESGALLRRKQVVVGMAAHSHFGQELREFFRFSALFQEPEHDRNRSRLNQLTSEFFSTATKASCGMLTWPISFIRFLPSFCFSSSLRLRLISPP